MGDLVPYAPPANAIVLAARNPELAAAEQEKRIKEAQELEAKLNQINESVPTRIYNVCGSTAGAGSGDFHQYRMIRRAEQMRQKRLDEEHAKKELEEQHKAKLTELQSKADERTAKRRAQRQKKKDKKKAKKCNVSGSASDKPDGQEGDDASGSEEGDGVPEQSALD